MYCTTYTVLVRGQHSTVRVSFESENTVLIWEEESSNQIPANLNKGTNSVALHLTTTDDEEEKIKVSQATTEAHYSTHSTSSSENRWKRSPRPSSFGRKSLLSSSGFVRITWRSFGGAVADEGVAAAAAWKAASSCASAASRSTRITCISAAEHIKMRASLNRLVQRDGAGIARGRVD